MSMVEEMNGRNMRREWERTTSARGYIFFTLGDSATTLRFDPSYLLAMNRLFEVVTHQTSFPATKALVYSDVRDISPGKRRVNRPGNSLLERIFSHGRIVCHLLNNRQ